jgi:hypothetical protein
VVTTAIRSEQTGYRSSIPFVATGVQAAAVYCSDGRFGEQMDDFLHNALKLPRYDRLALPGGAACFAGHFATYREEEGAVEHLKFLARAHRLTRLVLISHEGCGYYSERLSVRPFDILSRQRDDLATAARRVRGVVRSMDVEAFLARHESQSIIFEPVPV